MVGRVYRVVGVEYRDGKFANLKVYKEPGDPYGEVLSHLRHGDEIVSTGFKNFAGQTWVQHLVDEKKRGLYKGKEPKPPYVGWSYQDYSGSRWLQCLDVAKVSGLSKPNARPVAAEMLDDGHLPDSYDNENVFAKIMRGEIPSYKIFETEHAFAILDAYPLAPFHCLLLPKDSTVDLSDLSPEVAGGFMKELPRLVRAVKLAAAGCTGVKVISNVGSGAGQVVMHTHIHVIPCFESSPMVDGTEPRGSSASMIDPEEAQSQVKALKELI